MIRLRQERGIAQREKLMLIGLGVVAIAAVAFLVLSGGGDEDPGFDDRLIPTRSPTPEASPSPTTPPRSTAESFEGRDPFQPLVSAPRNANGGVVTPDDGVVIPDDGDARRLRLLDIFTANGDRFASVDLDGEQFTVGEGERFAENFRLLTLTRRCGTFVFGDERFMLCIGQEVRK